ncbi:RNA binding motif, single stranded interacting protein 3 [Linnemannia zychae]|nr:RNA binding motif, single stranded interacting protein 3 [Linnemannia zychae]
MPSNKQHQFSGHGHETTQPAKALASVPRGDQLRQTQTHNRSSQHQANNDSSLNHPNNDEQGTGSTQGGPFFMKPLTKQPDYRYNLYVKGLAPTTNTRGLYELFKPYGHILACKTILDNESGFCRGGFVLFDNQTSCDEARRELTRQGLYIAIAHPSVSIKNIPAAPEDNSVPIKKDVPKLDDSDAFPCLPTKPAMKVQKKVQISSPSPPSPLPAPPLLNSDHHDKQKESNEVHVSEMNNMPRTVTPPWDSEHVDALETPSSGDIQFGNAFSTSFMDFDFDTGFFGTQQQTLPDDFHNGYDRRSSILESKPYGTIGDVDRYMNMWDMNTAVSPQMSTNTDGARQSIHPSGAHITSTLIDDFMLEDRPRHESVLFFNDLPDGLTYRELFEICAAYGPLVLTSVEIRYINENCCGQGKVTFESYQDFQVALNSLSKLNYNVQSGDSGDMYPTEPNIDDNLYNQYYELHQSYLQLGDASSFDLPNQPISSPSPHGFVSTIPSAMSMTHSNNSSGDMRYPWNTTVSADSIARPHSQYVQDEPGLGLDMNGLSIQHESISNLSISQNRNSFNSSSTSPLPPNNTWTRDSSSDGSIRELDSPSTPSPSGDILQPNQQASTAAASAAKFMSYSDMVKVPPKPVIAPLPPVESGSEVYFNPPSQDLKRRGNTSKSLDEKEYRLNLYLKDLEPTMNEFKLYQICVKFGPVMSCRTITTHQGVCTGLGFVMYINNDSVDRAIAGLKELGYHAEIAIQSATNKLRCKVKSDTLFLQNIPTHIKEAKDPKTGQGRGVAFLKMKDVKVAERFIEEYHGRVLGKDWKLPLQVSPAKH